MGLHIVLVLFVGLPLAELFVLLEVGSAIGALPTIALCIATAVLGTAIIRRQGLATLSKVQASLNAQELPAVAMLEGAFLLVAGVCLLTPGLITDVLGFACLVPPLRLAIIEKAFVNRITVVDGHSVFVTRGRSLPRARTRGAKGRIIEGEYRQERDSS